MPFRLAVPASAQSSLKCVIETPVGTLFPVTTVPAVGLSTRTFAPVCTVIIGGAAAANATIPSAPRATTAAIAKRDEFQRKLSPPCDGVRRQRHRRGHSPRTDVQRRPRER